MIRLKLCVFALFLAAAAVTAAEYKFITPYTFDRKVEIQVAGKSREYYALSGSDRVQIKVKGPTRLRVLSRALAAGKQDSIDYEFLGRRDGAQKAVTHRHRSHGFENAVVAGSGGGAVTSIRSRVIDVPRGDQTYTFYLPRNSKQTVFLRFAREFKEFVPGSKIVGMSPVSYSARVDLVTREEVSAYYRVGSKDNVKLQLIGPATLKVLTRIEFDQNMNGRQKWRVQVVEDGKVKSTHSLSAVRSQTTTYRETSPFVPSRAEALVIEIPAGTHNYEFRLPDNHRTALFRFLLPEKQLERD